MTTSDGHAESDLLAALRHPLRREILRAMGTGGRVTSPREISEELGEKLSNVSYHVRVLAQCCAVVLVGTEPVRGSMQHFYSMTIEEPWALSALGLPASGSNGGEETEGSAEHPGTAGAS